MNDKNSGGPVTSREIMPSGAEPEALERLDHAAFRALYFGTRNRVFNVLMPFLSIVANRGAIHLIVGALLFGLGNNATRRAGAAMLISTGIAGILAEGTIKFIWKRKRPFMVMDDVKPLVPSKRLLHRPSFPSGHAAGYMAAATAAVIFLPAFWYIAIPIAVLGSFSRIYNGVHFPSDVIAGMAIGVATAFGVAAFMPFFFELISSIFIV